MAGKIVIKNGKSGRQVASGLRQHDQTMHGGKKAPKIVVKNGKNGGKNGGR
jgi:hypothetical protein